MESETIASAEFRREVVLKFVKDVTEGRIALSLELERRRPEDVELLSNTAGRLISYLDDYLSGTKAGEEFDFLERQLFFSISVLRTYDAFKTKITEPEVKQDIRNLENKIDSISKMLEELVALSTSKKKKSESTRRKKSTNKETSS